MARALLPDMLLYNPKLPASFPNGRTLVDDGVDVFLRILTNGKVTRDNVWPQNNLERWEFARFGWSHNYVWIMPAVILTVTCA